jgi:hypothetical protein
LSFKYFPKPSALRRISRDLGLFLALPVQIALAARANVNSIIILLNCFDESICVEWLIADCGLCFSFRLFTKNPQATDRSILLPRVTLRDGAQKRKMEEQEWIEREIRCGTSRDPDASGNGRWHRSRRRCGD